MSDPTDFDPDTTGTPRRGRIIPAHDFDPDGCSCDKCCTPKPGQRAGREETLGLKRVAYGIAAAYHVFQALRLASAATNGFTSNPFREAGPDDFDREEIIAIRDAINAANVRRIMES
jgi:hypothetical protein